MRRKKGFSLIELIIVLAIIAILAGILIPSWGYYIQRSRTGTQNNRAKIIFNAAQNVVTEMQMHERKILNEYEAADSDGKTELAKEMYTHVPGKTNEWWYYFNGSTGIRVDAKGDALTVDEAKNDADAKIYALGDDEIVKAVNASDWNLQLSRGINKILDEYDTVYKIYVKDYQVQSVVCSRFAKDRFIGSYPMSITKIRDMDGLTSTAENLIDEVTDNQKVKGAHPMTLFDSDTLDLTT